MNKKKIVASLSLGALSLGLLFGAGSPITTEASQPSEILKNHVQKATEHKQGEKPAHVYKDAQTGVYTEVYAENPADRAKLMKEQGWTENDPIEIVNKEKNKKVKGEFENSLSLGLSFLNSNFGTITASAGTDTSGWDLVGTEGWIMYPDLGNVQRDTTWHSHGGDYSWVVPAHSAYYSPATSDTGFAELYDNDGGVSADDYITTVNYYPSSVAVRYTVSGMSNWLDGAELEPYTKRIGNYAPYGNAISSVKYYD